MYDEALLIAYIKAHSVYTNVDYTTESVIDISTLSATTLPRVFVGHIGVEIFNKSDISANGYNEIDNPQHLITQISFICPRVDLTSVFLGIQSAIKGFSPFINNENNYGSINFMGASAKVKTSDNVWWVMHYNVEFPRIS